MYYDIYVYSNIYGQEWIIPLLLWLIAIANCMHCSHAPAHLLRFASFLSQGHCQQQWFTCFLYIYNTTARQSPDKATSPSDNTETYFLPPSKKRAGEVREDSLDEEVEIMAAKGAEYWKKVVTEQIQKSHVIVYSKTTCPFCKRVSIH